MSLARLLTRAAAQPVPFLLAGGDPLVLDRALHRLGAAGLAGGVVGAGGTIRPDSDSRLEAVAGLLRRGAPDRVRDGIHALDLATDPLRFALGLLRLGEARAVVAGPGIPFDELTDAARWVVGLKRPDGAVHSASWFLSGEDGLIACADCALARAPDPAGLAAVARSTALAHEQVANEPPRVALLGGPATADPGTLPEEALAELERLDPALAAVADRAVRFRGRANVLIFPSGTAGHLAVRLGRALAGTALLGPLVLGLGQPVAGVAPDATEDELVGTVALAVLLAGAEET